jgi:hypothetical protein
VNKDIFVGGKGSTMHVFPCQTATVNRFQNRTGLLSALPKSQNICIINKTNTSSREIRGVAYINQISIVKKEKNGRERRALGTPCLNEKGEEEKLGKHRLVDLSERKEEMNLTSHWEIHLFLRL